MSVEKVRAYLSQFGCADRIRVLDESSATVALAAQALGCEEKRIAKTMAFDVSGETVLVVAAGDVKIDNAKFKSTFAAKARMLRPDQLEERVGYPMGGVCPFGVNEGVKVYLDESLKRFDTVYPACGTGNSAIRLSLEELERLGRSQGWVDVCREAPAV